MPNTPQINQNANDSAPVSELSSPTNSDLNVSLSPRSSREPEQIEKRGRSIDSSVTNGLSSSSPSTSSITSPVIDTHKNKKENALKKIDELYFSFFDFLALNKNKITCREYYVLETKFGPNQEKLCTLLEKNELEFEKEFDRTEAFMIKIKNEIEERSPLPISNNAPCLFQKIKEQKQRHPSLEKNETLEI